MISEDVKTVIDCQYLKAKQVEANELTAETIVVDSISTNLLTLVDPADATKTGTLEEIGTTLEITAPTVQINGNAVVTHHDGPDRNIHWHRSHQRRCPAHCAHTGV